MGIDRKLHACDPVLTTLLNAPIDDEPETPEEATAVALARAEMERGELVPWEEVKRSLHTQG